MDPNIKNLPPGDPKLIANIVNQLKSQGIFDEFRRDCLADVDTKPAYQNLQHRVENFASDFLKTTQWRPDLNKNQLRDGLRRHINESGMLTTGVDRIIDQIVNPKIIQIFFPKITEIVHKILGIEMGVSKSTITAGSSNDSEMAATLPKLATLSMDSLNNSQTILSESKIPVIKESAVNNVPSSTVEKLESQPYIDAIEEQLKALTGAGNESLPYKYEQEEYSSPTMNRIKMDGEIKKDKGTTGKSENVGKTSKKIDNKIVPKEKSTSSSDKHGSREKKSEKPAKREHSPSKASASNKDGEKSSKPDIKKGPSKSSDKSSRCDDRKTKSDESSQKARKPSELKESTDSGSKSHHKPPIVGRIRHDKFNKTDTKICDESTKNEKHNKSKHPDSGKSRVSESDKHGKHKTDKAKMPDKKHESGRHRSESKSVSPDKGKHGSTTDRPKSSDKQSSSGSHAKTKVDSAKQKSSKLPEEKLFEADKVTVSKPKLLTPNKSSPSDRDDKTKSKKDGIKEKSTSGHKSKTSSSARPEKASVRKPETPINNKGNTKTKDSSLTTKDGNDSFNDKVLKRQLSDKADNSPLPKKPKHEPGDDRKDSHKISAEIPPSLPKKLKYEPGDDRKDSQKISIEVPPSPEPSDESFSDESSYSSEESELTLDFKIAPDATEGANTMGDGKGGNENDNGLSDVTVSSVHTSDLSDFDDHITLSESEEERAQSTSPRKKSRPFANIGQKEQVPQEAQPYVEHTPAEATSYPKDSTTQSKETKKPNQERKVPNKPEIEVEPRRELRRQRKLNPRYTSDEFSSIFNTGKDKMHHGHLFDHTIDDVHRSEMPSEIQSRGRRSTGHSTTTDETEFPYSPTSDVSEISEVGKRKSSGRGKLCSPSESSDGDHSLKGPASITSEVNENVDFRPRTFSQQSGSGRKPKHERSSPNQIMISPTSDNSGRRHSKNDSMQEPISVPKRAPARYDNQRYSSTDLYKPRPVFSSSRRRAASPSKQDVGSNNDFGNSSNDETTRKPHQGPVSRARPRTLSTENQQASKGNKRQSDQNSSGTSKRSR